MSSINIPLIIQKKRDGKTLSSDEINYFISSVVDQTIPHSQIGALLMAIYFNGMSEEETVELTRAMVYSGHVFRFPEEWTDLLVDKHSTGGVGDKISLILAPALAAFGFKVPMVSGRGLSFTGGTLDKLESIPGFKSKLSEEEMTSCLKSAGCFIGGASDSLAPADAVLYKQRDITATVDCFPLVASSILSKKVAEGTKTLVLDIKVGKGSFVKSEEIGRRLADVMVIDDKGTLMCGKIKISKGLGVDTKVVLSSMDQPLGYAIGNSVEVEEAIRCLRGEAPPDIRELVNTLGGVILLSKGTVTNLDEGKDKMDKMITDGSAMKTFHQMLMDQGVAPQLAQELCYGDFSQVLPQSRYQKTLLVNQTGYVQDIDALELGLVSWKLGAGRTNASDPVDHSVGLLLKVRPGQRVQAGDVWIQVLMSTADLPEELETQLQNSIAISRDPLEAASRIISA